MSSHLALGERISNFILRDAANLGLQISPAEPQKASTQCPASCQPEGNLSTWQSRAVAHTRLVQEGLALYKSKDAAKAKEREAHQLPETQSHFRLLDLPAEIQEMIFDYIFKRTDGRIPKLLWALRGNKIVWESATRVYCKVNNFSTLLGNGPEKKDIEAMPDEYLRLIRNLTVVVPKSTQQTIHFTTRIVLSNIQHLTIQVTTVKGLRVAAYIIVPKCPEIDRMTVVIKNAKDRQRPGGLYFREAYLHSFSEAIRTIDKMLGVDGRPTESQSRRQKKVWTWRAVQDGNGGKRFKMTLSNNHIRFE